ncbi:HNH endonuclease family protein [Streptomyces sp. NPDC056002]|uniref:HNH endonuclease family protein n=1 Tax=Streptomyces sp. NPDC056002 TaxID=3345675 RepID=UPI0035D6A4A8
MFKEFEYWLSSTAVPMEDVFAELARYAEIYDRLDQHPLHGIEGRFLYRMKVLQTSTPMPLLLFLYGLHDAVLPTERLHQAIRAIDSYLVSRAILNLSSRDYNNIFRELVTVAFQQPERADEAIIEALAAMQRHHRQWPTDAEFRTALEEGPIYTRLYHHRVRIPLEALEDELRSDHTAQLTVPVGDHLGAKLTIEHVMSQSWRDNWPPLDDDPSEGYDPDELVHTLGNLTLVTARLNPALGNMAWDDKRQWLSEHSLLRLTHGTLLNPPPNSDISRWASAWDEHRIHIRGAHLASLALGIWPQADDLLASPVVAEREGKGRG